MDATPDPASQQPPAQSHEEHRVTVRRSPKYGVFTAIGALIGIVVAWIVSSNDGPTFDESGRQVDTTPVIGLMLVVGFVVGGVLGAIVAIIIDRALSKGTRTVVAERVETREAGEADAPADAVDAPADAGEAAFERLEAAEPGAEPGAAGTADEPTTAPRAAEDDRPREA